MTDKEIKKLTEAFGIPEPDRKKEFSAEFLMRSTEKKHKPLMPLILRFAAIPAMLAVITGVILLMPKNKLNFEHDNNNIPLVTQTSSATDITVTTTRTNETVTQKSVTTTTAATSKNELSVSTTASSEITAASTTSTRRSGRQTNKTTTFLRPASTLSSTRQTTTTHTQIAKQEESSSSTTSSGNNEQGNSVERNGRDLTVSPDTQYDVRDNIIRRERLMESDSNAGPDFAGVVDPTPSTPIDQNLQVLFDNSYNVVLAKIEKIVYTSIDGEILTAENIIIERSYKGDLAPEDKITVYMNGGYMPAEEFISYYPDYSINDSENFSILDNSSHITNHSEGSSFLFFIKKGTGNLPNGVYRTSLNDGNSVFGIDNGFYYSLGSRGFSFTSEELEKLY